MAAEQRASSVAMMRLGGLLRSDVDFGSGRLMVGETVPVKYHWRRGTATITENGVRLADGREFSSIDLEDKRVYVRRGRGVADFLWRTRLSYSEPFWLRLSGGKRS